MEESLSLVESREIGDGKIAGCPGAAESPGDECRPTVGEGNRGMASGQGFPVKGRGKTHQERGKTSEGTEVPLPGCRGSPLSQAGNVLR